MLNSSRNIFERLQAGEIIPFNDPQYYQIRETAVRSAKLLKAFNSNTKKERAQEIWEEISGAPFEAGTIISAPIFINIGRFTRIGKDVYINHACSFLDMGTITIEDEVLIGPNVQLITEGHPNNPKLRKALFTKPITIKKNAWIGAGATVLPGVTIGENAIVAARAVVNKDIPDNAIVGGIPAKTIKSEP